LLFFAMGFEHSVVNLFVIPLGMALGAKISFYDWWYWNEIPALFGNLVGGFATGFALYTTNKPDQPDRHSATITRHPAHSFQTVDSLSPRRRGLQWGSDNEIVLGDCSWLARTKPQFSGCPIGRCLTSQLKVRLDPGCHELCRNPHRQPG
jgi:hypothetical protein